MAPQLTGGKRNAELKYGDNQGAGIPARRVRQLAARSHALQDQERRSGKGDHKCCTGERGHGNQSQIRKTARRPCHFSLQCCSAAAVLANQPRLPSALSARRSIGSTITLVPTLTRE